MLRKFRYDIDTSARRHASALLMQKLLDRPGC